MKQFFDIKYRIGKKEKDEIKKAKTVSLFENDVSHDGWIVIQIGDYEFGFIPEDDSSGGIELLDEWFKSLKKIYEKLKTKLKIVFDYWDDPHLFFVFEKKGGRIHIHYFEKIFPTVDGRMQITDVFEIRLIAETEISEENFFGNIKQSVNMFWEEIANLNPALKDYAEQFKIV